MKHRGFNAVELLVTLAGFMILIAILFPIFNRKPEPDRRHFRCNSNLKQIGLGVFQYLQDYNQRYPKVAFGTEPFGWADALYPYVKRTDTYQCPVQSAIDNPVAPPQSGFTDYWINRRVAGLEERQLPNTALVILAGDGNDGTEVTNARYALASLPDVWRSGASPATRHKDGANYLYCDGHVKRLNPQSVSNDKPAVGVTTFAPR